MGRRILADSRLKFPYDPRASRTVNNRPTRNTQYHDCYAVCYNIFRNILGHTHPFKKKMTPEHIFFYALGLIVGILIGSWLASRKR